MTADPLDPYATLRHLEQAATVATTDDELVRIGQLIRDEANLQKAQAWQPYPWQHPHLHPPGWVSERAPGVCDERCHLLPAVEVPAQGTWLAYGGRGCVAGWTRVYLPTEDRHERIDVLAAAHQEVEVLALTDDGPEPHRTDGAPFLKGHADMWEVTTLSGTRVTVTDRHRFLTPTGWRPLADVLAGLPLGSGAPAPPPIRSASLSPSLPDEQRSWGTPAGWSGGSTTCPRPGGPPPPSPSVADPAWPLPPACAAVHIREHQLLDATVCGPGCSRACRRGTHRARKHSSQAAPSLLAVGYPAGPSPAVAPPPVDQALRPSPHTSSPARPAPAVLPHPTGPDDLSAYPHPTHFDRVMGARYVGVLPFYDMTVPGPENYAAEGLWHHNTGKTEGAAHYVDAHVRGPSCDPRIKGGHKLLIVGPTQGDAIDAMVEGVSGLKAINPAITVTTTRGGTFVRWPNGTRARVLGASTPDDIERLRASGNNCLIHLEEVAAMRRLQEVRDISSFGLRIGSHAHYVAATTPKNRPEMQAISADPDTIVTKGRTRDAHRLNPVDRAKWESRFGGTTLGRQELDAEELGDVEGALWVTHRPDRVDGEPNKDERPGIANDRVKVADYGWRSHRPDAPPPTATQLMHRVIVGVDPPGGRTEAGIVVFGTIGMHGYVLADLSKAGPPDTWAQLAIAAYYDFGAEGIAAEHTYGGDMVHDVLHTRDPAIPIFKVPTKVGKRLRAEPVQGLYQQHRIHHVGVLPGVEGEQTTWVPGEGESPNRVDALVHAATFLMIRVGGGTTHVPTGRVPGH